MKTTGSFSHSVRIFFYLICLALGVAYCTVQNGYLLNDSYGVPVTPATGPYKGVGAYIITLDRSKERWAYVKPSVDKLGFPVERISAVDGKALAEDYVQTNTDQIFYSTFDHVPTRGTIGCSLSHIKTWKAFLESIFEYALIFEDDVSFDPKALRGAIEQLVNAPEYWDVNTFSKWGTGTPLAIKSLQNNQKLCVYFTKVLSAAAYLLNRKAACQLLEKALPLKMQVDFYFTRGWELDLKFTGIENPLLVHQTYGDSDIGDRIDYRNFSQGIMHFVYRRSTETMKFLYSLKCYVESYL